MKQLTSLHTPRWHLAALVAPALLCGTAVGVLYWLMSAEETARFIDGYLYLHQRMDGGLTGWQQAAHRAVQVLFVVEVVAVQRLGSNRNYVYQVINVEMGMSFSEYVNRMRVEYAEQLLQSHPTMTLAEVAERSGFASSTSFYRNFKLLRGCSPKEAVARQRGA